MLNQAALRACGYTKDTPNPPGGEIQRDSKGNPTGLLIARPNATILYATLAKGPKLPPEHQLNSTRHFMRELNRLGLTSIIDAGGGFQNYPEDYAVIEELHRTGEMTLRIAYALLAANKWPFRLHATYDESITHFLRVFEEVNRDVPFKGLNWFFDHCETISDRNLERVKALGGGIAIQHRMAYQGEYFMDRYGTKAAERTPPVRRMLDLGIPVGAGTDATRVASYNPWVSLYWLVTGKTVGGVSMYPDKHRLTREEALRLYTQGSSWFSSESGKKGAIAAGQLADLVALTEDYFSVPEDKIKGIESVLTVVGGKVVHATGDFAPHAPPPIPVLPEWSPVKVFGGYGAPLDVRNAARAGVPMAQAHEHSAKCHHGGCAHAAYQPLAGVEAARNRYADFFGLGCDCFAF